MEVIVHQPPSERNRIAQAAHCCRLPRRPRLDAPGACSFLSGIPKHHPRTSKFSAFQPRYHGCAGHGFQRMLCL